MNDQEERAFGLAYRLYKKWRETVIETEAQWAELAEDVGKVSEENGSCRLGWKLTAAVLDALNELYRDGAKPMPANYFGREDL